MPEERAEMGRRGREWMVDDFTWPAIAKQALAGYDAILSALPQRPKPA
jgi:glycosyltransferase involved in cell wall biosynthesis